MKRLTGLYAFAMFIPVASAHAESILWSHSDGQRSASVKFTEDGSDLRVILTNTSTSDVMKPDQVLTALFFEIQGNPLLARTSAVLAAGSVVLFPPSGSGTDPGGVVGGEWAYDNIINDPSQFPDTPSDVAAQGVSSTGLGPFGPNNRFPGSNLQGPVSPDGLQYGITSLGDDPLTGNTPVTGSYALVKNSVIFTLSGLPSDFDLGHVSNVSFQYGTDFDEPRFAGEPEAIVPEPGSLALLALGSLGLVFYGMRQRRRS